MIDTDNDNKVHVVRLDKWLWAARFFKTRAIARLAILKGKVLYNHQRSSPSIEVQEGAVITLLMGYDRRPRTIRVEKLCGRRKPLQETQSFFTFIDEQTPEDA